MKRLPPCTAVAVRPWRAQDAKGAVAVLREGSFSNVRPAFKIAIRRPATRGMALAIMAACWMAGMSAVETLIWTFCFLPLLIYLSCWIATLYFFYGPNFRDMDHVEKSYFACPDDHFWVAAANGEIVGTIAVVRKEDSFTLRQSEPDFSMEMQDDDDGPAAQTAKSNKVLSACYDQPLPPGPALSPARMKVAWLRRMAVRESHRGQGIAKRLVRTAVDFCQARGYGSIFLITTEVHEPARGLYASLGFRQTALKRARYCAGLVTIVTYEFEMDLLASGQ